MKLNNNLNYDLNERLDRLISNKKLVLLIPGVIITVMAVVLLIMAVFPQNGQGNGKPTLALNDRSEVTESEAIETKDYLASLDSEVAENLHILTQDSYLMDSETVLTQYESLEQRLKELLKETATFLETSTSTSTETAVMLTEVSKELETIRADLQSSRESYEEMLERILANGGKLENLGSDLQKTLNEESQRMQAELTSKVLQLTERLTTLKTQIESSQTETENLFNQLESAGSDKQAEIAASFIAVMGELAAMKTLVRQTHEQYQAVFVQMSSTIEADIGAVNGRLDGIKSRLDDVFQSVSSGKATLASTLTALGENTASDADFETIDKNIKALYFRPQPCPHGDINPDIEYEYHRHRDGSGAIPGAEIIYLAQPAPGVGAQGEPVGVPDGEWDSCYKMPVYHVHEGNPNERGGCYQGAPAFHVHYAACYTRKKWDCVNNCPYLYTTGLDVTYVSDRCLICGWYDKVFAGYVTDSPCVNSNVLNSGAALSCGLTESSVVGYRANCGRYDGEMVSAKIVFPPSLP
ncbi:MAG: hypothetical protein LBI54_07215 [Lachnospiraceae bacterium]|jgi:hypothetical protein|nr:hypothetical protein [Lachnospiraceae bacterium]